MSYSEQGGQVVLTMSREDYRKLLMIAGMATAAAVMHHANLIEAVEIVEFLDRLNQGNPNYRPYRVGEK